MTFESTAATDRSTAGGVPLGENEAAVIDTFAVPAYLRHYWEVMRPLVLFGEASRVVHLGCLTGYPDGEMLALMPNTAGVGVDLSLPCLSIAAAKMDAFGFDYLHAAPEATELPADTFSHALTIHPRGGAEARRALFGEMSRIIYPGAQVLVGMPLRSSFPEILDLLLEYAIKGGQTDLSEAVESAKTRAATIETIAAELAAAGLSDVSSATEVVPLTFDSGRALLEDPSFRFFILPQLADWLEWQDLSEPLLYVARAIDKYWSGERFELTVAVGAISARA